MSTSTAVSTHNTDPYVSRFFDAASLAGLEKMRFTPRRAVDGSYSGRHTSRRRGGSGEFVDYREYTPGDDLRRVDWKAMGRMGRAYLKLFQDDTDLNCTLALDCSGSMAQGAAGKQDLRGSKFESRRRGNGSHSRRVVRLLSAQLIHAVPTSTSPGH